MRQCKYFGIAKTGDYIYFQAPSKGKAEEFLKSREDLARFADRIISWHENVTEHGGKYSYVDGGETLRGIIRQYA